MRKYTKSRIFDLSVFFPPLGGSTPNAKMIFPPDF